MKGSKKLNKAEQAAFMQRASQYELWREKTSDDVPSPRRLAFSRKPTKFDHFSPVEDWVIQFDQVWVADSGEAMLRRSFSCDGRHYSGFVWPSLDLLLATLRWKPTETKRHLVSDLFEANGVEPEKVREGVDRLVTLVGMGPHADITPQEMRKVNAILRKKETWELREDALYRDLIYYLGEATRRMVDGAWVLVEEDGVKEPYILRPDGRSLNPWLNLGKRISEGSLNLTSLLRDLTY